MAPMTREQGRAWRRRWRLVEERERAERVRHGARDRLRQFLLLADLAGDLGPDPRREEETARVRARWRRLRLALRG